VVEPISTFPTN